MVYLLFTKVCGWGVDSEVFPSIILKISDHVILLCVP